MRASTRGIFSAVNTNADVVLRFLSVLAWTTGANIIARFKLRASLPQRASSRLLERVRSHRQVLASGLLELLGWHRDGLEAV